MILLILSRIHSGHPSDGAGLDICAGFLDSLLDFGLRDAGLPLVGPFGSLGVGMNVGLDDGLDDGLAVRLAV